MGATLDEVVNDYMTTYENYYGVEKNSKQYNAIAESNIITSLTTVLMGYEKGFVIEAPSLDNYYVETGDPLIRAYPGHTNIAVCINYGKLNEIADIKVGDKVTIMLTGPEEYLVQKEIITDPSVIMIGQKLAIPAK